MSDAHEETGYRSVDPEDLPKLRQRTQEHERRMAGVPLWSSKVVTQAKCQAHPVGCRELVDVTEAAIEAMQAFDRLLGARGEKPLDLNECFPCSACLVKRKQAADDRLPIRRAKNTDAIRLLNKLGAEVLLEAHGLAKSRVQPHPRASPILVEATAAVAWLTKSMGKDYAEDLVRWLVSKQQRKSSKGGEL